MPFKLEANAQAQLDVSRLSLSQRSESTKAAGVVETQVVIGPLVMIENVSEDALEFQVDALRHSDAILDAEVHIPVGQPTEDSSATVPAVYTQNWVTPVVRLVYPVRKIIHGVAVCLTWA